MDTETASNPPVAKVKPRRVVVAALLSFLETGLGHIYCGRLGKGLVLFFIGCVLDVFGGFVLVPTGRWGVLRWSMVASSLAATGLWLYAMIDACVLAARIGKNYVVKEYNRWYVYAIVGAIMIPVSISLAMAVRQQAAEARVIANPAMSPTLDQGDRVLVNKIIYGHEPARRGDIVLLVNPDQRNVSYIRRLIALPGETVEIKDRRVWVNGRPLSQEPAGAAGEFLELNDNSCYQIRWEDSPATAPATMPSQAGRGKITVPTGHCYVLGDNRRHSEDSRKFGPVPLRDVIGRVDFVYFPRWVNLRKEVRE